MKKYKEHNEVFAQLGIKTPNTWQKNYKDWIKTFYWRVVPFRYRPSFIWDRLSSKFWYKHTTIKPRTFKSDMFVEYGLLFPHVMFEMLIRYVEMQQKEKRDIDPKLLELYNWWHLCYLPHHERMMNGALWENEDCVEWQKILERKCQALIKVHNLMWKN